MKKEIKKIRVQIELVASFDCCIYQNALNIASALMQAGRFVNMISTGTGYKVDIYQRVR